MFNLIWIFLIEKFSWTFKNSLGNSIILEAIMNKTVENSQIKEFITNLKGRKAYEEKKAIKLGFSNFEDYVADKISNNLFDSS